MESENNPVINEIKETDGNDRPAQPNDGYIKVRKTWLIAAVFAVAGIIVGGTTYCYLKKKDAVEKPVNQQLPLELPTQNPINSESGKPNETLVLKHISDSGDEEYKVIICEDCGNNRFYISKWKDWIIWGGYGGYQKGGVFVSAYNLETKSTVKIFDINSPGLSGDIDKSASISDFRIVDDTLFFSLGGYMTEGGLLYEQLPPAGSPEVLIKGDITYRLVHWRDRDWIIEGFGDGGMVTRKFNLFNPDTKKILEIATSVSGIVEGEELVDIDKRNKMIMAFHTVGYWNGEESENGIYKYVTGVYLDNPKIKEEIISGSDMPENITEIKYDSAGDRLILYGKTSYIYSFNTHKITETVSPPELAGADLPAVIEKVELEEQLRNIKLPNDYRFEYTVE